MQLIVLPLIAFLAVLAIAVLLLSRHDELSQQQLILNRIAPPQEEGEEVDITRQVRTEDSAFLGSLLSKFSLIGRLEESLWQAGLYVRAIDVLMLMLVLAVAGAIAASLWTGGFNLVALLAALAMGLLPLAYIKLRKRRRLKSFDTQLPEILDMLKSSLEAGHTLQRALQAAVDEFGDPASGELRIVLEQNRLGVPLARALEYMLVRLPDENLRFLVVAVKIQSEVGSSLASIVGQLARTIRDRQRLELKVRALTAQPRLAALIGGLMPIFLLIALHFVSPDTVNLLFHDPTGIKITEAVVVLEILAMITINRLTRTDY